MHSSAASVSVTVDPSDNSPFSRWCLQEYSAPTADDPYATVLFNDVRLLLTPLKTPEARRALRLAWLSFLGLRVPGLSAALRAESADQVASPAQVVKPMSVLQDDDWEALAGYVVAREKSRKPTFGPVKEWSLDSVGVFTALGARGEGRMWEEGDIQGVDVQLLR